MFKNKGSLTLIAVLSCLICIALGIFYGLSRKGEPIAETAPVYRAEHPGTLTVSPAAVSDPIPHIEEARRPTRITSPKGAGVAAFSHIGSETATATATMP